MGVMEALRVVFPQYWLMEGYDESFKGHMNIIKGNICYPKRIGAAKIQVPKVSSFLDLDLQMLLFKLTMKNNAKVAMAPPHKVNPLTRLWTYFATPLVIVFKLCEYFKLTAMVRVIGFVEDKRCFSNFNFIKSKQPN
jgi:hypothetical protein